MSTVSPAQVASRVLCLGAIIQRGFVEFGVLEEGTPEAVEAGRSIREPQLRWLKQSGLWKSASADEKKLLRRRVGRWLPQDVLNASWRADALGMLLWALRKSPDVSDWDKQFSHNPIDNQLPLGDDPTAFVFNATLRPAQEIQDMRNLAELWLWRARTARLLLDGVDLSLPEGITMDQVIAEAAAKAGTEEGWFTPIEGDFPAFGKAYRDADERQLADLTSIATERLYALNWMTGQSRDWDRICCDT